jgi:AcrR family transcriptional regulator
MEEATGPQSALPGPSTPGATGLPVLGVGVVRERADAARNRLRVLAAAERLFAERGVPGVTMDDVAAAAGVGKGTLYRRFVDKGGLAGPLDRLAAFVAGYLSFLDRQLDLVLLSETSTAGARLRTGAHAFWRQHCALLLREAGAPEPELRADLLLAGLAAEQVRHWLRDQGRDLDGLIDQVSAAAVALGRPDRP